MTVDLNNYTCSNKGLLLPIINEYTWAVEVRAFLYLVAMLWFFLGIAIVADVFMTGIENITSKTRIIRVPNPEAEGYVKEIEVKVWNDTVANLSLMAFGTSAPEILLAVIEICGKGFKAGELGPGTIVGSAAFNLLIITAICIVCIPKGEVRSIKNMQVYITTTVFSMFAYIWIVIVLLLSSPEVIELWEAIITLLMFPTLLIVSYLADKRCGCRHNKTSSEVELGIDLDSKDTIGCADIIHLARQLGEHNEVSEEDAANIALAKLAQQQSHNRGWYRINAMRKITSGHRLVPHMNDRCKELSQQISIDHQVKELQSVPKVSTIDLSDNDNKVLVEFTAVECAVMENDGNVRLGIRRYGNLNPEVTVWVETVDGSGQANEDYIPFNKAVRFLPNEKLQDIYVEIVDDNVWEPDEYFYVKLYVQQANQDGAEVLLGKTCITRVTIINDDEPGTLTFSKASYVVREGQGTAQVFVNRMNGADGKISVQYRTYDLTAVADRDYRTTVGTQEFEHGETSKAIEVDILKTNVAPAEDRIPEMSNSFCVELFDPTAGAQLGKVKKCIVTIVSDDEFSGMVSRIAARTKENLDALKLEKSSWAEQFQNAININGGDVQTATALDYLLHFCSFFWKVLFACIPPPSIGGGWLTFSLSLAVIGIMTAIVGDLASIFGCLVGLSDTITAITFVALGTSMPDTFASKQAALAEKYADSSIGNINGSNAVNVFLGLGLPWLIASIYWNIQGSTFDVPIGDIGISVIIYMLAATLAIIILAVRRHFAYFGCAELGGPQVPKIFTAIIISVLWILYIVLSSLNSSGTININVKL